MTQKELLYVEDAISHEKVVVNVIDDMIKKLEDKSLVNYMNDEKLTHQEIISDLESLLEDKANE